MCVGGGGGAEWGEVDCVCGVVGWGGGAETVYVCWGGGKGENARQSDNPRNNAGGPVILHKHTRFRGPCC